MAWNVSDQGFCKQRLRIDASPLGSIASYYDPRQPMAAPDTLTVDCLQ